jgi:fibronectin-binding autotransporter adhesin
MNTQSVVGEHNKRNMNHQSPINQFTAFSKRSKVMNTTSFVRRGLVAVIAIFLTVSLAFAGNIKNKNTFNNPSGSTVNVATFFNYSGGTGGTLVNGGLITATTAVDNANGTSAITNTGTITITGATGLLNNVAGAAVTNSLGGLIDLQNAASAYNNAGGTTTNTASAASQGISIAGTLDVTSGTFTTTNGRVIYTGTGSIYSGVASSTYGVLEVNTAGTRTMNGNVTSSDINITAGTMSVGTFKLTATGSGGIQGVGTLVANAAGTSEVDYAAAVAQPIKATAYAKLTLSNSASPVTKTATAAITVGTALSVAGNNTLAMDDNFTFNGTAANFSNAGAITVAGDAAIGDAAVSAGVFTYNGAAGVGDGNQSVAAVHYSDLTLSGADLKTLPAATVYISGSYAVLGGTGARTYTGGSVFQFNGATQTVAGEAYGKLEIYSSVSATLAASASAVALANNDALFINSGATFIVPALMTMTVNTGDLNNEGTVTNNGTITVN